MKTITLWLIWLFTMSLPAGERIPDMVMYDGSIYHLRNAFPLDSFLSDYPLFPKYEKAPMMVTRRGQMDGTDNPNFHVASWIVLNERLYLSGIEGFVYPSFDAWYLESMEKCLDSIRSEDERRQLTVEIGNLQRRGVRHQAVAAMDYFFPDRIPGQPIFADWFSGELILNQAQSPLSSGSGKSYAMTFRQGILQTIRSW